MKDQTVMVISLCLLYLLQRALSLAETSRLVQITLTAASAATELTLTVNDGRGSGQHTCP